MMGFGFGGGLVGNLLWSLFLLLHMALPILIIAGTVWLLADIRDKRKKDNNSVDKDSLSILRERYAKGEISYDEYKSIKDEIVRI